MSLTLTLHARKVIVESFHVNALEVLFLQHLTTMCISLCDVQSDVQISDLITRM